MRPTLRWNCRRAAGPRRPGRRDRAPAPRSVRNLLEVRLVAKKSADRHWLGRSARGFFDWIRALVDADGLPVSSSAWSQMICATRSRGMIRFSSRTSTFRFFSSIDMMRPRKKSPFLEQIKWVGVRIPLQARQSQQAISLASSTWVEPQVVVSSMLLILSLATKDVSEIGDLV